MEKKRKLEVEEEDGSTLDPKVLKQQRDSLIRELKVQKASKDRVPELEKKYQECQADLSSITRAWSHLDEDLKRLADRIDQNNSLLTNEFGSNFIEQVKERSKDLEEGLKTNINITLSTTESLIKLINGTVKQTNEIGKDQGSKYLELQELIDKLQSENSSTQYQLKKQKDENSLLQQKLKDIKDQWEDSEIQLEMIRRKCEKLEESLHRYESSHGNGITSSSSSSSSQPSSSNDNPQPSAPVNNELNNDQVYNQLKSEIESLKTLSENRLKEIKSINEEKTKIESDYQKARLELSQISQDSITSSGVYKALLSRCDKYQAQTTNLENALAEQTKAYDELELKLKILKENYEQRDKEKFIKFKDEIDLLSKEEIQLKTQRDKLITQLDQLSAQMNSLSSHNKELKTLTQTLKSENTGAKNLIETLKRKNFDKSIDQMQREYTIKSNELSLREKELNSMLDILSQTNGSQPDFKQIKERIFDLEAKIFSSEKRQSTHYEAIISDLEKKLAFSERTEKDLYSEIDSMDKSLQNLQEQNNRLLKQLDEKEDVNITLLHEQTKVKKSEEILENETKLKTLEINKLKTQAEAQSKVIEKLKQVVSASNRSAAGAEKEIRESKVLIDINTKRATEKSQQFHELQLKSERSNDQLQEAQKIMKEKSEALDKISYENKRNLEEIASLKKKLSSYDGKKKDKSSKKEVNEELEIYKKMVNCGICQIRHRQVVLKSCFHLFCQECIDNRLAARMRKCPHCDKGFGAGDVAKIFYS